MATVRNNYNQLQEDPNKISEIQRKADEVVETLRRQTLEQKLLNEQEINNTAAAIEAKSKLNIFARKLPSASPKQPMSIYTPSRGSKTSSKKRSESPSEETTTCCCGLFSSSKKSADKDDDYAPPFIVKSPSIRKNS